MRDGVREKETVQIWEDYSRTVKEVFNQNVMSIKTYLFHNNCEIFVHSHFVCTQLVESQLSLNKC